MGSPVLLNKGLDPGQRFLNSAGIDQVDCVSRLSIELEMGMGVDQAGDDRLVLKVDFFLCLLKLMFYLVASSRYDLIPHDGDRTDHRGVGIHGVDLSIE